MRQLIPTIGIMVIACAGHAPSGEISPDDDVVTQDQIAATDARTAYDALRMLRPAWLQQTSNGKQLLVTVRAGQRPPPVDRRSSWTLYVDDRGYPGDQLRRIEAIEIRDIRLIAPQALRPDRSRCNHRYPAIHVRLSTTN